MDPETTVKKKHPQAQTGQTNLLGQFSFELLPNAEHILDALQTAGATTEQKEHIMDILSTIAHNNAGLGIRSMNHIEWILVKAPPDSNIVGKIQFILKKYGNDSTAYLNPLASFLGNPHLEKGSFTDQVFKDLCKIVEMRGEHFDTSDDPLSLGSVVSQANFRPEMLKKIKGIAKMTKLVGAVYYAVKADYFENSYKGEAAVDFASKRLDLAYEIAKVSGKAAPPALFHLGHILAGSHSDYEVLDGIRLLTRQAGEKSWKVLSALKVSLNTSMSWMPSEKLPDFILMLATFYSGAEKLVASLGAEHTDPEVCLNFAYGIATIGSKKTQALYRNFGMEYFMRYTKDTLEALHSNIDPKSSTKPLLLVAFNKNDPNSIFYREGSRLFPLTKHYCLVIVEVGSEAAFYDRMHSISKRYGKIGTLIIGGHGAPDRILLGKLGVATVEEFEALPPIKKNSLEERRMLDLTDLEELKKLRSSFTEKPIVLLVSCSTGKSEAAIGGIISDAWGATLYAPAENFSRTKYLLSPEGRITDVEYNVESTQFLQGKITRSLLDKP